MKYFFPLLFFVQFAQSIQAQGFPYVLTVDQAAYTPLENAISANNGEVWDDLDILTPLGFNFQLWSQNTASIFWYGELTAFNVAGLPGATTSPLILTYGTDLIDRGSGSGTSVSPISYKTEGAPGSRVFKMEWENAGFFDDESGTAFTNLQVWLYEGSNDIELRFGPTQINDQQVFADFSGPMIGFMDQYNFANDVFQNLYYLTGPIDHPSIQSINMINIDTLYNTLNEAPDSGLVYRFSQVVAVEDPAKPAHIVQVYPSPVQDILTIKMEDQPETQGLYTITDPSGRALRSGNITTEQTQVNVSGLPGGMYFVQVVSRAGIAETRKVWKE